jgi:hypothetical protein
MTSDFEKATAALAATDPQEGAQEDPGPILISQTIQ